MNKAIMDYSRALSSLYLLVSVFLPLILSCKVSEDTLIIDKDGPITKQDFKSINNTKTTTICIKGKNITSIEPGALCIPPNLSYLQIYPIPISNLSNKGVFRGCDNLKVIHSLGEFEFKENLFIGLKNLEFATFWNAKTESGILKKEFFAGLKSLKELNILFGNFKKIPSDAFSYLKNLRKLEMSYDAIESIEKGAFKNLKNLTDLDLSFNSLSNLNWNEFDGLMNLQKLYLSGTKNFPKNTKKFLQNFPQNLPNLTELCIYEKSGDLRRNYQFYTELKPKFTRLKTVCGRTTL